MNIYKRKLTKVGRSGIAIFLPIAWIRGEKLQKGDFVELIEDGGVITVKPKKETPPVNPERLKNIHNLENRETL